MYLTQLASRGFNLQIHSVRNRNGKRSDYFKWILHFITITTILVETHAVELTFELPDNAKECFYEIIEEGKSSTVEFQVVWASLKR